MKAIERRALQSEAMSLWLGAACKLIFLQRTPEKEANAEPSTEHAFESVRLCAPLFQARPSIDTMSWFLL